MPLPFLRQEHLAALERIRENLPILSVHQDDALRVASLDETNEVVVARVRAEVELLPLALDVDRDAVEVNHAFVDEAPSVRPFDLITCQEDRAPRILTDLLEVPQDRSAVEHAARRHDHLASQRELRVPRPSHDAYAVHRLPERLDGPHVLG